MIPEDNSEDDKKDSNNSDDDDDKNNNSYDSDENKKETKKKKQVLLKRITTKLKSKKNHRSLNFKSICLLSKQILFIDLFNIPNWSIIKSYDGDCTNLIAFKYP